MFFTKSSLIKKPDLYAASEDDLKRFANYLRLKTEGYSHRQRARLIYWLLTRNNLGL